RPPARSRPNPSPESETKPRRPSRSSARVPAHGKNIRATPAVPGPNDALPCLLSLTVVHAPPTNSGEPGLKTPQCSELETYPHDVRRLISHASPFHPRVVRVARMQPLWTRYGDIRVLSFTIDDGSHVWATVYEATR